MVFAHEGYFSVKNAETDSRGRLTLDKSVKDTRFRVYKNEKGQYLLDPIVTELSAAELQLLSDPSQKAALEEAIQQAKDLSKLHDLGSFSKYAD